MNVNSSIQSKIDRINKIVATTNTTDFLVQSLENGTLLITGSFDHAYYHELEIRFHGVGYIALPSMFDHPELSIATDEQQQAVPHIEVGENEILFVIHEDPNFNGGRIHFVVAETLEITEGMVYYYVRKNLGPGERIADWVDREE